MRTSTSTWLTVALAIINYTATTPSLAQQAEAQAACTSAEYRAFDFWLGSWQVSLADGSPAGSNTITAIQSGCVIKEEWQSATSSFTGTSYNFYDTNQEKWRQIWLDNQGGSLDLAGNKEGKQMILRSQPEPNAEGQEVTHQITWTHNDDGSVRQLWETFTTGQPTVIAFDGLYVKDPLAKP